jgi:hypothetical protein
MEGFVHPTRRQRLADVSSTLQRVFAVKDAPCPKLVEHHLRRLEDLERARGWHTDDE